MTRITLLCIGCWLPLVAQAQLGGQETFAFLRLPPSARVTALGNVLITTQDDDVALALGNPATLNARMNDQLSFNSAFVAPDVYSGYAAYAHSLKKWTLHGGIQYLNYGKIVATDEIGTEQGTLKANDYALTLGAGRKISKHYSVGINARFITSQLESYHATGIAADLGAMYLDTAKGFTAAIVLRNVGAQLSSYYGANGSERLPTELQMGISQRLRHLPFRVSLTLQHLERWEIRYDDPYAVKETNVFGQTETADTSLYWLDNAARHLAVGGEFLLGKKENFRVRLGYNHLLRSELLPKNTRGFVGLSFGMGFKVSQFRFEYGYQIRHFAGGTHAISIAANLGDFRRKASN